MASVDQVSAGLAQHAYIGSSRIATVVYLAFHLRKPVLVEGPPGVGKTELAKTTARMLGLPLIRLQCYEGIDEAKALYEWKYGKQLMYIQVLKDQIDDALGGARGLAESVQRLHQHDDIFFSEAFLEPRPLLKALREREGSVLLLDEIDKSDEEFESLLLEMLSDYQVTVPEIGTIAAAGPPPIVFLTSNNTREVSDALKRRCLHLYIPFPDARLEEQIIRTRVPEIPAALRGQLVAFVQALREMDLRKAPAISETIDWARTLLLLHVEQLDAEWVSETLNVLLKFQDDIDRIELQLPAMIRRAVGAG
ncbi:MoxR family ATPase [Salinisphaera sp. T31B1]|uniref:AAA family ATPase n=1 Tax=Salinisphaera sp. T31B1 TaxID=727963 RepID=UPI003340F12D